MKKTLKHKDVVNKVVVFVDICSSSFIMEDLLKSGHEGRLRALLVGMKEFLKRTRKPEKFEIYKFLGDGWVLLFKADKPGKKLLAFLHQMADEYARLHQRIISPCLTGRIQIIGLTFGVDQGKLIRLKMNGRWEYIGRPLNVAARLQSALKAKDDRPQGKILMAKAAFRELGLSIHSAYQVEEVTRELKNMNGGKKYKAKRIWLYMPPTKRSAGSAARLRQGFRVE